MLPLQDQISNDTKQKIATEINFSDTAFVSKSWTADSAIDADYCLRWYTPTSEIDLRGHATVATARVVFDSSKSKFEFGGLPENPVQSIKFDTKFVSTLIAGMDTNDHISVDFPAAPTVPIMDKEFSGLEKLLCACLKPGKLRNRVDGVHYSKDMNMLLVKLSGCFEQESKSGIEEITPDFRQLMAVETSSPPKGIIVTVASSSGKVNFYSRYFAPWLGVNEDPITGSVHTVLMPFWSNYHPTKAGSKRLVGKQCSGRGGIVNCVMDGGRVTLTGLTDVVVEGSINV